MKTTIRKFYLEVTDEQFIGVPLGAKFISVGVRRDSWPVIWAIVQPDAPVVQKRIVTVGEGLSAENAENMRFVGTYQVMEGSIVGHVFVDD